MGVLLPIFGTAYAASCLWLIVRIVNRRNRWAKWNLAIAVVLPMMYVLSFGPACWLNERGHLPDSDFGDIYGPILIRLPNGKLMQPIAWFVAVGTRNADATIEDGQISWNSRCKSGLKKIGISINVTTSP